MILRFLQFMGTNSVILGIASISGIAGFCITIIVALRTVRINKILQFNEVASAYNKTRRAFQKTFDGHRTSILEDNNRTDVLLKDILKQVESYDAQFHELLSLKERIVLWRFKRILRKRYDKVSFIAVCNHLAELSGRLSKHEEKKNG